MGSMVAYRQTQCWRSVLRVLYPDLQTEKQTFETSEPILSDTIPPTSPHLVIPILPKSSTVTNHSVYKPRGAILIQTTRCTSLFGYSLPFLNSVSIFVFVSFLFIFCERNHEVGLVGRWEESGRSWVGERI